MKIHSLVTLSFISCLLGLATLQATVIPADSSLVQIEGRYATLDEGSVCEGYPGVVTRVEIDGSTLILRADTDNDDLYIDVSVDGGENEFILLSKGSNEITLFQGEKGQHLIEITKRVQTWRGLLTIREFDCPDGEFLAPPALPEKKLLFIGDSITCGEACDIREGMPQSGAFIDNGRLAFGTLIARKLNAQCHLISYGGRGIIRDWQGIKRINNAPVFYERALADDADSFWDPSGYVPDAIGICLGQNDFNQGIPDQNEFVNAYVEFLRKVRRDAPDAKIFLIESPMHGTEGEDGVKRQALGMYLDKIVSKVNWSNVKHVHLGQYPGRPENAHPVASEHVQIARVLTPYFAKALGCEPEAE